MSTTYFSERERGPRPRMAEAISQPVRRALLRQIQLGIGNGSYGWRFPEQCGDERGPCGTDERAFWDTAAAEVPDLLLPENASLEQALRCADDVDTVVFLDLLEFCARAVARPVQRDYHSYYGHYHLGFDRDAGLTDFLSHVNQLFRRNGSAHQACGKNCAKSSSILVTRRPIGCLPPRGNAFSHRARRTVGTRWRSSGMPLSVSRHSRPVPARRRRPIASWTERPNHRGFANFWVRKPWHSRRSVTDFAFVIRKRPRNPSRRVNRSTTCFTGCSAFFALFCARQVVAASCGSPVLAAERRVAEGQLVGPDTFASPISP